MIEGPLSEDYFWFDESESDHEFLDHWDATLSSASNDDWGWDEWGDLVVFRPMGYEPEYKYPLVIWLSLDDVSGVTLRDWFPDLSDRNYLGAEVQLRVGSTDIQHADRVAIAIREVVAFHGIHKGRVWLAGTGHAADAVLRMLPILSKLVNGGIAIAPTRQTLQDHSVTLGNSLYLAVEGSVEHVNAEVMTEDWERHAGRCHLTVWESIGTSRLAMCRDLNAWLMHQVCTPAGQTFLG